MSSFPIIDLSALTNKYLIGDGYLQDISSDPDTRIVSDQIMDAFEKYGFIYVKGHNIPQEVIDSSFEVSRKFFELDSNVKEEFARNPKTNWGYVPFKVETFEKSRPFDLKECFNYLPISSQTVEMDNILSEFIQQSNKLFSISKKLGMILLKAITLGLNTEDKANFLYNTHNCIDNFDKNPTTLRLLYYPAIETVDAVKDHQLRCGEHSDYGTLTLLFQDDAGGLQVSIDILFRNCMTLVFML